MPLEGCSPEPGDLIEFNRKAYQHWGVYVGGGNVVHLTVPNGSSSQASSTSAFGGKAVVKEESLEHVAHGCSYRVNNKYDKKRTPRQPEEIVKAAREEVGKKMHYSVSRANCEHFVTELRYGTRFSDQGKEVSLWQSVGVSFLIYKHIIPVLAILCYSIVKRIRKN